MVTNLNEHVEYKGEEEKIILKTDDQEIMLEIVDWIDLAQDGDKWRAGVNKVMYCVFHKMGEGGHILSSWETTSFPKHTALIGSKLSTRPRNQRPLIRL